MHFCHSLLIVGLQNLGHIHKWGACGDQMPSSVYVYNPIKKSLIAKRCHFGVWHLLGHHSFARSFGAH